MSSTPSPKLSVLSEHPYEGDMVLLKLQIEILSLGSDLFNVVIAYKNSNSILFDSIVHYVLYDVAQ